MVKVTIVAVITSDTDSAKGSGGLVVVRLLDEAQHSKLMTSTPSEDESSSFDILISFTVATSLSTALENRT